MKICVTNQILTNNFYLKKVNCGGSTCAMCARREKNRKTFFWVKIDSTQCFMRTLTQTENLNLFSKINNQDPLSK